MKRFVFFEQSQKYITSYFCAICFTIIPATSKAFVAASKDITDFSFFIIEFRNDRMDV